MNGSACSSMNPSTRCGSFRVSKRNRYWSSPIHCTVHMGCARCAPCLRASSARSSGGGGGPWPKLVMQSKTSRRGVVPSSVNWPMKATLLGQSAPSTHMGCAK